MLRINNRNCYESFYRVIGGMVRKRVKRVIIKKNYLKIDIGVISNYIKKIIFEIFLELVIERRKVLL